MAFLTIAGNDARVSVEGPTQPAPERIGYTTRSYNGTLRSSYRYEKRNWSFKSVPLSYAAAATIRSACSPALQVTCNGDFNNNVAVTCEVLIGDAPFFPASSGADSLGYMVVLTYTLREV